VRHTTKILDTTLRDGSYVVNFGFTAEQTTRIAAALDDAGIDMIEVGHGVGLNASKAGQGQATETDEAYMEAAARAVRRGKWGMFAIPGICDLSHLEACFDHSIGVLRFGVSIDSFERVLPFVEKAKSAGVITCVNFMKSYTREPLDFEQAARRVVKEGADYVYVVDSAGNMTPSRVRQYCERISDLPVGFHAHNNLGLAVANALIAEECGAQIIDCSLQGMGRCTGNTMTEHFVALMQRTGKLAHINLITLLDTAEELVRPLLRQTGHDSVDLICGYSGFHSSYMDVIRRFAIEFDVDPRLLIMEVCKVTQSDAPDDLVREKAKQIRAMSAESGFRHRFPLQQYFGREQTNL
jgi:4-hydroxy-2-oxovalerate aldolase